MPVALPLFSSESVDMRLHIDGSTKKPGSGIGGALSPNQAPVQEALIRGQGFPGNHEPLAPHLQSPHSGNPERCLYRPSPTTPFVQMIKRPTPPPPTGETHSHGKQLEKKASLRFQTCPSASVYVPNNVHRPIWWP